jgi:hypothetical protein
MARTWASFAGRQRKVNSANPRPAWAEDPVNPCRPPTNQVPPFIEKITRDDDLFYEIVVFSRFGFFRHGAVDKARSATTQKQVPPAVPQLTATRKAPCAAPVI